MTANRAMLTAFALAALSAAPFAGAAPLTPGMYEYVIKMNMPGAPAAIPTQTVQRCLSPKDVEGSSAYRMPPSPNNDCQLKDMKESGGTFSYKMACTKPQKMDSAVQGTVTATSMNMDMTMTMDGMPGPMTQNVSARRVGDCKQ